MSAGRDQMIDGLRDLHEGLQRASAGLMKYANGYEAVSRATYPDLGRVTALDATIGLTRLHALLVMRLRAVGFGAVLAQARTTGKLADGWVADFTETIHAQVRR